LFDVTSAIQNIPKFGKLLNKSSGISSYMGQGNNFGKAHRIILDPNEHHRVLALNPGYIPTLCALLKVVPPITIRAITEASPNIFAEAFRPEFFPCLF
jgi:hypothetical protein